MLQAIGRALGLTGPLDAVGLAIVVWLFIRFQRASIIEHRELRAEKARLIGVRERLEADLDEVLGR